MISSYSAIIVMTVNGYPIQIAFLNLKKSQSVKIHDN